MKSKIIIEQFSGYDEISAEDIDKDFDYSYLNIQGLNDVERQQLEVDLINLIKLGGRRIESINLPNGVKTIIPEVLKNACTSNISFDGAEEYFEKMKNTPTEIPHQTLYKKLQARKNGTSEISEYDVYKGIKFFASLGRYTAESVEEYENVLKYIPNDCKVKIKVRNPEELRRIIAKGHINIDIVIISKKDLENLGEIDERYNIIIEIDNMSDLSIEELVELKSKFNIDKINILSTMKAIGVKGLRLDKGEYDIDTYAKLRRAIDEIVQGIDINASEIEKFTKIYERLAHKITYDYEDYEFIKTDGVEGRKNDNAHSLIGPLLEDLSVCEGISMAVEQTSYCVGIQAPRVHGDPVNKEQKWGHAWNRVKIDGIWYNADLTWDLENIRNGSNPNYCLQSTEEFLHDEYEVPNDEQTLDNTYNQDELFNYFSGRRFIIENGDQVFYSSSELYEIIKQLRETTEYISDGISIEIYGFMRDGGVAISNIVDGNEIQSECEGSIILQEDELSKFIDEYINVEGYKISRIGEDGKTRIVREDGIKLVLDDEVKETLMALGIDIDNVISPVYEIKATTLMKRIKEAKENDEEQMSTQVTIGIKTGRGYELNFSGDDRNFEIKENELIEFLQTYGESFKIEDEQKKGRSKIELISDEGINLLIDRDTKEEIQRTGCDFSLVFREYGKKLEETKSQIEELAQEIPIQEQKAIIEYKESFIRKIINRAKEIFSGIKIKIFQRGDKEQERDIQNDEKTNSERKSLPSWDLRNWTPEELKEAKIAVSQRIQEEEKDKTSVGIARDD